VRGFCVLIEGSEGGGNGRSTLLDSNLGIIAPVPMGAIAALSHGAWEIPDVCVRMKKTRRYDLGQKRKDNAYVQL